MSPSHTPTPSTPSVNDRSFSDLRSPLESPMDRRGHHDNRYRHGPPPGFGYPPRAVTSYRGSSRERERWNQRDSGDRDPRPTIRSPSSSRPPPSPDIHRDGVPPGRSYPYSPPRTPGSREEIRESPIHVRSLHRAPPDRELDDRYRPHHPFYSSSPYDSLRRNFSLSHNYYPYDDLGHGLHHPPYLGRDYDNYHRHRRTEHSYFPRSSRSPSPSRPHPRTPRQSPPSPSTHTRSSKTPPAPASDTPHARKRVSPSSPGPSSTSHAIAASAAPSISSEASPSPVVAASPDSNVPAPSAPRKAARMKPESHAFQRKMLEQWRQLEVKPQLVRSKRGLLQVFPKTEHETAIESDDAGAGPLDNGDSMYRGRSSRSRVTSQQSGVSTRARSNAPSTGAHPTKTERGSSPDKTQIEILATPEVNADGSTSHHRKDRSPFPTPSEAADLDDFVRAGSSTQTPAASSPHIERLNTASFVNNEALEEDEDGMIVDPGDDLDDDCQEECNDEYDYSDSFIDDRSNPSEGSESDDVGTHRRPVKRRRLQQTDIVPSPAPVPPNPVPSSGDSPVVPSDSEGQPRPSRTAKRKGKQRVRVRSPSPPPLSTTAATSTPPGDVASQTPADTSSSSDPTPTPATAASSNSALFPVTAGSKVTMAELVARHTAKAVVSGAVTPSPPKKITMKIGNGYYVRKCLVLPEKCEVTDPDKWDPLLALIYAKLPHLKAGTLITWTDAKGPGQVSFRGWAQQCPTMPAWLAFQAVNYTGKDTCRIRGVARLSPELVLLRSTSSSSSRHNYYIETPTPQPLIGYLAGYSQVSQLTTVADGPLAHRFLTVTGHTQEWERFVGFVTTACGIQTLHAQLGRDAMQFSTRAQGSTPSSTSNSGSGRSKSMFSKPSSSSTTTATTDQFLLPNDVDVPIYDARNAPETFDLERDMPNIATVLPRYEDGEVPEGSLVGVGFTMSIYRSNVGNMTLGCNILWVILFGTPSSESEEGALDASDPQS